MEGYVGTIVTVVLALSGVGAAFVTLRANFGTLKDDFARRFNDGEVDRKDLRVKIDQVDRELRGRLEQVDRESFKREDFNRFDDKTAARFKELEATVNNAASKTENAVRNALRDFIPGKGQ